MSVSRNIPLISAPIHVSGGSISGISSLATQAAAAGPLTLDISGGSQAATILSGAGGIALGIASSLTTPSIGIQLGTPSAGLAMVKASVETVGQPALASSVLSNSYTLAVALSTSGGAITSITLNSGINVPITAGNNISISSGSNQQVVTLASSVASNSNTTVLTLQSFVPNFNYPIGSIVNLATLTVNGPFEAGASSVVGPLSVSGSLSLGGALTGVSSVLTKVETCSDLSLGFTTDAGGNFVETTFLFATTSNPTYSATVTLSTPPAGMDGFRKRIVLCRWTTTGGQYFVYVQPSGRGPQFYPPGSVGSTRLIFDTQGQSTELTWSQAMQGWFVLGSGGVFS